LCEAQSGVNTPDCMEWRDLLPGIIGSFVGVMGWLLVGLYIQRRQFMRQARNAAKAVYFEVDVNLATISVARDHALFADLDRSSFERLLPELATLMTAADLRSVVDAYMTHAGYRQLASREDLPVEVRRGALGAFVDAHERALETLAKSAFTRQEARAVRARAAADAHPADSPESVAGAKP
jgi:hypothetical protein